MTHKERGQLKTVGVAILDAKRHLTTKPPNWGAALQYVSEAENVIDALLEPKPQKVKP